MSLTSHDFDTVPPLLWHYTSVASTFHIVRSQTMWATDSAFLNDSTENKIFQLALYKQAIVRYKGEKSELRRRLCHLTEQLVHSISRSRYIISLSNSGDLLPQWRAYADDGAGVALGLMPRAFQLDRSSSAVACYYVSEEQILADADRLLNEAETRGLGPDPRSPETPADRFIQVAVDVLAPVVKDAAYAVEQEVRVVIPGNPRRLQIDEMGVPLPGQDTWEVRKPAVRPRGVELIPYVEVGVKGAFAAVRLGPKAPFDLDRRMWAMTRLFEFYDIPIAGIAVSEHQYRG